MKQWLSDSSMAELSEQEQVALGQLLAELHELPPAAISPQLEGRLYSLSKLQPAPSNALKRLLTLLAAGVTTAGALLAWQFSGLELKVAQNEPVPMAAPATAASGTRVYGEAHGTGISGQIPWRTGRSSPAIWARAVEVRCWNNWPRMVTHGP